MDDPELDPDRHRAALRGLARINCLSGAHRPLLAALTDLLSDRESLRLLDIATGGGDVVVALARAARRGGCVIRVTGVDQSEVALQIAVDRAAAEGVPFDPVRADVLADELPGGHDVVMSSLFLHHLSGRDATRLLRRMAALSGRRLLVDDLRRGRFGTTLAAVVPRLLTRSRVVHVDALRSARAAFRPSELSEIARRAGLESPRIRPHWPARMLLVADSPS